MGDTVVCEGWLKMRSSKLPWWVRRYCELEANGLLRCMNNAVEGRQTSLQLLVGVTEQTYGSNGGSGSCGGRDDISNSNNGGVGSGGSRGSSSSNKGGGGSRLVSRLSGGGAGWNGKGGGFVFSVKNAAGKVTQLMCADVAEYAGWLRAVRATMATRARADSEASAGDGTDFHDASPCPADKHSVTMSDEAMTMAAVEAKGAAAAADTVEAEAVVIGGASEMTRTEAAAVAECGMWIGTLIHASQGAAHHSPTSSGIDAAAVASPSQNHHHHQQQQQQQQHKQSPPQQNLLQVSPVCSPVPAQAADGCNQTTGAGHHSDHHSDDGIFDGDGSESVGGDPSAASPPLTTTVATKVTAVTPPQLPPVQQTSLPHPQLQPSPPLVPQKLQPQSQQAPGDDFVLLEHEEDEAAAWVDVPEAKGHVKTEAASKVVAVSSAQPLAVHNSAATDDWVTLDDDDDFA